MVGDTAVCLWPGRLQLSVSTQGGAFSLAAHADRALDLFLPGGDKRWPQSVLLDGRPAVVLEREGMPVVRLAPGPHKVEGRFLWDRTPDSLPVPQMIAIVDLSVDGRPVPVPRREEGGLLLLRQGGAEGAGGENLQIKVFRKIADGIPLFVETRIVFDVSGKAREVVLEGAPPGRHSAGGRDRRLPARLTATTFASSGESGDVQGSGRGSVLGPHRLVLGAEDQPSLAISRSVGVRGRRAPAAGDVTGAVAVDASRTDLPERMAAASGVPVGARSAALKLRETRRGEPDGIAGSGRPDRRLWLDEDGAARSRSAMTSAAVSAHEQPLNPLAPAELGRVAISGSGQLITSAPGADGAAGVELREATLRLEADSRLPRAGAVAAVGWAAQRPEPAGRSASASGLAAPGDDRRRRGTGLLDGRAGTCGASSSFSSRPRASSSSSVRAGCALPVAALVLFMARPARRVSCG